MTRLKFGGITLAALSLSLVACAPPEVATRGTSRGALDTEDDSDSDSEGGTDGKTTRTAPKAGATGTPVTALPASPRPAAVASVISANFLGSAKLNFNGAAVGRVCSDRGAEFQNATFLDGTSLRLVSVDYPDQVIASVDGAALQTVKNELLSTGYLNIPIANPAGLPKQPYEFAIVMGGDGRFGTPQGCGVSMKPGSTKERDVEEFPNDNTMLFGVKMGGTGCGVVGYVEVYYDTAKQVVVARGSSQLLLAADDEGRGGFPAGNSNPACDWHDSPLVLDLGNQGVKLGTPVADVFDVDGDGSRDMSPWVVSEETPFLVRDANGNGSVDGIDEMFGNRTLGPSGQRTSQNGFEALGLWDDTADGKIDKNDKVWSTLRLWFDRNHDGRTDPGELETLESRGVRSIAVSFVPVKENLLASGMVQGSVRQRGGAEMTDGRIVNVVDVWFDRRRSPF